MSDKEDSALLAEQLGAQRAENRALEDKLRTMREDLWRSQSRKMFEKIYVGIFVCIVILSALAGVGYLLYMNVTQDETPSHCLIEWDEGGSEYKLRGVVPWHDDLSYGEFKTLEQAMDAASKMKCKLKTSVGGLR